MDGDAAVEVDGPVQHPQWGVAPAVDAALDAEPAGGGDRRPATAVGVRDAYDPAYPSAKPWLFGIAARLVSQHRRRRSRREQLWSRLVGRRQRTGSDDPEALLERATPSSLVAEALRGLPERDREPLLLHVWDGLAYDEVARTLDLPVGTVRSRIHRARTRLQDRLDPDPGAAEPEEGVDHG